MKDVNRRSVFSMIAGFFGLGAVAMGKPCKVIDHVTPIIDSGVSVRQDDYDRIVERWREDLKKHDAALRYMADTIPQGNALMFYPCGCSASGATPQFGLEDLAEIGVIDTDGTCRNVPIVDSGVPLYCPTHDAGQKRESECTVVRGTRLIHIEEAAALQSEGVALGRRPTADFQFQDSEIVKLLDAYYPEVGRNA